MREYWEGKAAIEGEICGPHLSKRGNNGRDISSTTQ